MAKDNLNNKDNEENYDSLTDAEKLLLAKEERVFGKEEEEEEIEDEKPDTAVQKAKKKVGFFLFLKNRQFYFFVFGVRPAFTGCADTGR